LRYLAESALRTDQQKKPDPNCVLASLYRIERSSLLAFAPRVSRACPRALGARAHHLEVFFFDNNASRKSDRICATRTPTPGVVETIQSQRGSAAKTAIFKPAQTI
jgi:hypothetical protein